MGCRAMLKAHVSGKSFGSSFSGKTRGFESRFGRSIRPLPAIAGSVNGRPERSERSSDCSIQSPATISCLSSKGQGSRLRTDKSRFESSQAHQGFMVRRPKERARAS